MEDLLREKRFHMAKKHNINGFSYHANPDRVYDKAKVNMFGNQASIFGCVDDDYNSCDCIQNILEEKMPEAIILGDISHKDMDYYRIGELKYTFKPQILPISAESALARKKMNKFFQQEIDLS